VIAEELERDDIEETLKAVDSLGTTDRSGVGGDGIIAFVTENDRSSLASSDLSKCGLDLGIQGILGHDDDNGHVLVDEGQGAVFEFSGKDTLGVHVADFLDLESTFQASSVLVSATHDQQTLVLVDNLG